MKWPSLVRILVQTYDVPPSPFSKAAWSGKLCTCSPLCAITISIVFCGGSAPEYEGYSVTTAWYSNSNCRRSNKLYSVKLQTQFCSSFSVVLYITQFCRVKANAKLFHMICHFPWIWHWYSELTVNFTNQEIWSYDHLQMSPACQHMSYGAGHQITCFKATEGLHPPSYRKAVSQQYNTASFVTLLLTVFTLKQVLT
jgi:hypothetical protein